MKLFHRAKNLVNGILRKGNLRIETLTAERAEMERLLKLEHRGHFKNPIFPILPQFTRCDPSIVFEKVKRDEDQFAALLTGTGQNGFELDNDYYTTPDAEVLYSIVQIYRPQQIIEVGSGSSTHLFRCAIRDAQLVTRLTSIDPQPRRDITEHADEIIRHRVEDFRDFGVAERLRGDDIFYRFEPSSSSRKRRELARANDSSDAG